jgi:hypothetical protein
MKIIEKGNPLIHVNQMEDGQIAIIRKWLIILYEGAIVQRYKNSLIRLGMPGNQGWPDLFELTSGENKLSNDKDFLVELLPKGTKLEIE